jgi:hypothetical protein
MMPVLLAHKLRQRITELDKRIVCVIQVIIDLPTALAWIALRDLCAKKTTLLQTLQDIGRMREQAN